MAKKQRQPHEVRAIYISRDAVPGLYDLETQIAELIKQHGHKLAKALKLPDKGKEFYTEACAQSLFDTLNLFDGDASTNASIGYMKYRDLQDLKYDHNTKERAEQLAERYLRLLYDALLINMSEDQLHSDANHLINHLEENDFFKPQEAHKDD